MRYISKHFASHVGIHFIIFVFFLINNKVLNAEIIIHDNVDSLESGYDIVTKFDTGPSTGNILNAHYYPGLLDYTRGYYTGTLRQMDYCLGRTEYIKVNPLGSQYISSAHYMRGLIYMYHASGDERYSKAKDDFEQSIQWDRGNHYAYIELARVHAIAGSKARAVAVLQQLLASKPPEELAQRAKQELTALKSESTKKKDDKHFTQSSQSPK